MQEVKLNIVDPKNKKKYHVQTLKVPKDSDVYLKTTIRIPSNEEVKEILKEIDDLDKMA